MAELNLIPSSMKSKVYQKNQKKNTYLVLIIIAAAAFFAFYLPYYMLLQLKMNETDLGLQVEAQSNIIDERNRMLQEITNSNELIQAVDAFEQNRQYIYEDLADLTDFIPTNITICTLTYGEKVLTIDGVTDNFETPAIFAANLQESDLYQNAQLVSVSEADKGYLFSISISLEK